MLFLLLAQAAAAPLPDIAFHATVEAKSVRIEKRGEARLDVHASPDAGSLVKVEAPNAHGARTLRNVRVHVDAEARIGSGGTQPAAVDASPQETNGAAPR